MRFRASDVAAATAGRLVGPDVELDGASFDSRSLEPGMLFVPIVAERDGHDFIHAARDAGAGAYLTARVAEGGTAIEVADTGTALLSLGAWARSRRPDSVVGITGSVGKTSTKDLLAAALATTFRTAANTRSFNNEQGLPVTILNSPDDTEVMVLEMGMRGAGEIARLCDVARPTVGVVTLVGEAHTELLGGLDGVARAKGELIEALPPTGTAVLNADDPRVAAMASRTAARAITYGTTPAADVCVGSPVLDGHARPTFVARTPWGTAEVSLAVSGAHMMTNAAAAIAAAGALGVPLDVSVAALSLTPISGWRMQVHTLPSGAVVVNDSYNANPTSMRAALNALSSIVARRRLAVLGVMAELDDAAGGHSAVADYARRLGVTVVAVGTDLYGITPADDPIAALGELGPGDAVLVKGSRVAGLERVAERLVARR